MCSVTDLSCVCAALTGPHCSYNRKGAAQHALGDYKGALETYEAGKSMASALP